MQGCALEAFFMTPAVDFQSLLPLQSDTMAPLIRSGCPLSLEQQVINFFGVGGIFALSDAHQLGVSALMTLSGIEAFLGPIFPALLVAEMLFLIWVNKRKPAQLRSAYKIPVLMYVANAVIAALINLEVFLWTQAFFSSLAPFTATLRIRWFVYAYIVWEFSHFIFHWTCHNVRLLWCIHAPHHAPTHMNLSVIFTALFLHGTYATFVRTAICSILGVPMPLLLFVMAIDGCWGALIHCSEELWPKGAMRGVLGRVILNPMHHRIHHASNPEYIDKNYCNTLPIWDAVFGTLQQEVPGVKPVYGLNREVKPNSFIDMYFGEIYLLSRDVRAAPTLKQKFLHLVMPPGWQPQ